MSHRRRRPAPREVGDLLRRFRSLLPRRVRRLLLLANRHDELLLEDEGQLHDLVATEMPDAAPRDAPWMLRRGSAAEALALLEGGRPRIDCVVATTHARDMHVVEFASRVRGLGREIPVALLAFDARELEDVRRRRDLSGIERLYAWQGDRRVLLAIVRSIEDRWNVRADTQRGGVASILLVEDSVRYYSAFLPMLHEEVLAQSRRVLAEGANAAHRAARMRARPKVLHATNHEEAEAWFREFGPTLLGIISDVDFPRAGVKGTRAGLEFARRVREEAPDLPILLQTSDPAYAEEARRLGTATLLKGSPTLLEELSRFVRDHLGFGEFVFRTPDGREVGRARDLRELEERIRTVPDASILHHSEGNDFSRWLRARTETALADELLPRRAVDFPSVDDIRGYLADSLRHYRRERQSVVVSDFDAAAFDPETTFARIGGGSLGGKARGLTLVRRLLHEHRVAARFPGVRVVCPSAVVLATDVFDRFLDQNRLRDFALRETDDAVIVSRFLAGRFPSDALIALRSHLETVRYPLAVRSSSLLEDSQRLPFAGIYHTHVIPNSAPSLDERLDDLVAAVERVWASTYLRAVKDYVAGTPYRLEEEKMAVLVQRLCGMRHGRRFYPDVAGVARSHNFYPEPPAEAADGVVAAAFGLGHTVVEGGRSVRFCPRWPLHAVSSSPSGAVDAAQTEFRALDMEADRRPGDEPVLARCGLEVAAEDGTLARVASTWSRENDRLYDGLGREGIPVVTFAPLLRCDPFPLAEIADTLLDLGRRTLELPVEIEFAACLSVPPGGTPEFAVVQMRPFAIGAESEDVDLESLADDRVVVRSERSLGNGRIEGLRDVVLVRRDTFDRRSTRDVARGIASMNARLTGEGTPYLLVGMGRWGSSDPWLGIPVAWEQIRGARVIVEAGLPGVDAAPSQGSHFFHNLTAANVAYLTVGPSRGEEFVDWTWLDLQPSEEETPWVRRLRLSEPLTVLVDGRSGRGAVARL